jgi:hypothetical protein
VKGIQALARHHGVKALKVILKIMSDPSVRPSIRLAAALAVHDRGYGRPRQEVSAQIGIVSDLAHLSTEQKINALKNVIGVVDMEDSTLQLSESEAVDLGDDADHLEIDTTGLEVADIRTIERFSESVD